MGKPCRHDVLGHVARGVGGAAVDLRRVLAGERAAAVRGAAAVGIDDDLAAGQAGVGLRAADDEAAGGVDEVAGVVVEQLGRDGRADDELDHILAQLCHVHFRGVLRAEHDGVHAHGAVLLVVLDRDLRLAVGPQIVHQTLLAHGGQALGQLVGQRDGQRHQLRRLVAGEAEHHALVARAVVERAVAGLLALERLVHAEGDVRALLVDVRDDGAGLAVKTVLRTVVADLAHGLAHDLRDVHVAVGRDLAHDVHDAGRDRALAGDAAVRVLRQNGVEDRVGHLVADLIGMSLCNGFGCKEMMSHWLNSSLSVEPGQRNKRPDSRRSAWKRRRSSSLDLHRRIWHLAGHCRLSGFTGPVPPPLLIRLLNCKAHYTRFCALVKTKFRLFRQLLRSQIHSRRHHGSFFFGWGGAGGADFATVRPAKYVCR